MTDFGRYENMTQLASGQGTDMTATHRVMDSCYLAKLWFDDQEVEYTAGDLLKAAELMLGEMDDR